MKSVFLLLLGSAIFIIGGFYFIDIDVKNKVSRVVVLGKTIRYGRSSDFLLIVKDSTGKSFDVSVSASSYELSKNGDIKFFKLRDTSNRTWLNSFVFSVLPFSIVLLGGVLLACAISVLFAYMVRSDFKKIYNKSPF